MASDDTDEHGVDDADASTDDATGDRIDLESEPRARIDGGDPEDGDENESEDEYVLGDRGVTDVAVEEVDQRIVDLLAWILDTETRAKLYVFLLANPGSTSDEVATGTGLYPSTVREALAELHEEEKVSRQKRASEGAGNNPYEYTAIQPSDLVGTVVDQVQQELNTIFALDRILDRSRESDDLEESAEPVTITVDDRESNATTTVLESSSTDDRDRDPDSDEEATSSEIDEDESEAIDGADDRRDDEDDR